MLIKDPNITDLQALEMAYAVSCQELKQARVTIDILKAEIVALQEKLKLAQDKEFGKSSERSSPPPPLLDSLDKTEDGEKTSVSGYIRKKKNKARGKTTDLSQLPCFQILHDLAIDAKNCSCCQKPLVLLGQETSKKLEVIPQKLFVAEHVYYKYTCRSCETIVESKREKSAIPKALAGDSLIAEILENKYQHHLPLYRQSQILENHGIRISDNTLSNWVMQTGENLLPLYTALWKAILSARYLQVDETPVKILKPDKKGYLWTYFAPRVGAGLVIFEASLSRSGEIAKKRLEPFSGLLQTDGYNGYQALRNREGIRAFGCLSHARRKFNEVITVSGDTNGIAFEMVERLKPLYLLEEKMRKAKYPPGARKKFRQKIARPILKSIHSWLLELAPQVPIKSKLGHAIAYTLKQWPFITHYLRHGWVEIDTNWVENQIRPIAIGKKNFLFMSHEQSATIHALFYSLVLSAILNKLSPRLYLHFLLSQVHLIRQRKVDPYLLLPHIVEKALLKKFAESNLQFSKSVLNALKF